MDPGTLTTVILCGGRGTRAYPHTAEVPKPLLEVGGVPILRHVMDIFAAQGCSRFVLAAGFRADMIGAYAKSLPEEWETVVRDTGVDAGTAERIWASRDLAGDPFFATYGDGLADIDLRSLLAFHGQHEGSATLTSVALPSQYGTVETSAEGRIVEFKEKPILREHWINGGFFVFDKAVFESWSGDDLEREVLPRLAVRGDLYSYRHGGFWKSMDTYKDALELSALSESGRPPWTPVIAHQDT